MPDDIKRPDHFTGELLEEGDFNSPWAYHLRLQRDHERLLHTPGVAEGLDIPPPPSGAETIVVNAGTAYDGLGRRILLAADKTIDLSNDTSYPDGSSVYVTIRSGEWKKISTGTRGDSRWTEDPIVEAKLTEPVANDPNYPLLLAVVAKTAAGLTVDNSARPNAGSRGGDLIVNSLTLRNRAVAQGSWPRLQLGPQGMTTFSGGLTVSGAGGLTVNGAAGLAVDSILARVPHTQTITANSDAVAATGAQLHLSGAADFKLTSTPSITAGNRVGQEVQIVNTGSKLITLQGRALSGSTLMLRSRSITLAPACSVTVVWDGSNWIEVRRATFGTANEHHVEDFGAMGDSEFSGALGTDDTAAIQAAINAASADGLPVVLTPGKLYRVTSELLVKDATVRIQGGGKFVGGILGTAPARSVVAVSNSILHLSDVQIYANRIVDHGVYIEIGSGSIVERCHIYQSLSDGIQIAFGSDNCRILDVMVELCGRTFATSRYAGNSPNNIKTAVTGTVSVENVMIGGYKYPVVTGVGTRFDEMGIRPGDFISVHATGAGGATSEWLQIYEVKSATEITCLPPLTPGHAAGSDYSVHVGDGYHEGPGRADNNNHCIEGWVSRNIGGCGIHIHGLYGPKVSNAQCDASGAYPVAVATQGVVTIGAHFSKMYFELNNAANNFFLGYAADIIIDQVNGTGRPVSSGPGFVWGVIRGMQNATDPGRVDPLGYNEVDYVPSAVLIDNSYLRGTLKGFSYAQNGPGTSSLRMRDNFPNAWLATSGIEPPQGGANPNAIAFDFDTATANILPGPSKRLMRWKSGGVVKAALDFHGTFFSPSADATATPGNVTIDKPSGRAAIAIGASSVTITNACVSAADTVQITALGRDSTCQGLVVDSVADGSFVVSGTANATAATSFMFTVLKAL